MRVINYPLKNFFSYFRKKGFEVLVLRGYEKLPYVYGGDLDIEVRFSQFESFIKELFTFSKEEGLHLTKYIYRPHVSSFKFYRLKDNIVERFILDITCRGGIWFGMAYLTNQELFEKSFDTGLWRVPCKLHEIILKIFTNMLIGNKPPKKYFNEISIQLPSIKDEFVEFISQRFPGIDALHLYKSLVEGNSEELFCFIPLLKKALVKRTLFGSVDEAIKAMRLLLETILAEVYFYTQYNGTKLYLVYSDELDWLKFIELLKKNCGHIWKNVILWHESGKKQNCLFNKILEKTELFRDRLIVVPVRTRYSKSGSVSFQNENVVRIGDIPQRILYDELTSDITLRLYRYLEKRNKRRNQMWIYSNVLWRFFGYKNTFKIYSEI